MKHLYYISGFAADERVFSEVDFGNYETHFIAWKKPDKEESLHKYAHRMAEEIRHPNSVLVGLSFGGIMAIEIARFTKFSRIILISSIKTHKEKPLYMRIAAALRLNILLPLKPYKFLDPVENYQLGVKTVEDKELAREYRRNLDPDYSQWAIDRILHWKNDWIPENLIHIHADDDRIFPIKYIHADYVIEGGGHLMLMNRSKELNAILKEELY